MNTPEKGSAGTGGVLDFGVGVWLGKVGLAVVGIKGLSAAGLTNGLGVFGSMVGGIVRFAVLPAVGLVAGIWLGPKVYQRWFGEKGTSMTSDWSRAYAAARILLAAIFLLSGAGKLLDVPGTAADIAALGLPFPALGAIAAGLLELACGVLLVLGRKTGWAAAALLLFMAPVTLLFEHPFRGPGAIYDFLKNLAVMGGLLLAVLGERDTMRDDWDILRGR